MTPPVVQVRPRSGLALKHGLTLPNSPATIAQLVFQRVEGVELRLVDELPASGRGAGGFGSTGA